MAVKGKISGKSVQVDILRSQLGRVRGLGAARAGSGAWWIERVTSVALVPLTLWFIGAVIGLEGTDRAGMIAWLHEPVPLVLLLCLVVITFWHMAMGLQVVIEDYVHTELPRMALILGVRAISILAAVFCVIAALRLGLGSSVP
ncbi:MAG TPA: succinate dehydrogenase, hydrophobic membrane anchor protein [Acetobacteraceae bacterium]|nr:succinate dehydrogenase, hydrophobic membrane anchor protein [Acetobacteraceae bacterium]